MKMFVSGLKWSAVMVLVSVSFSMLAGPLYQFAAGIDNGFLRCLVSSLICAPVWLLIMWLVSLLVMYPYTKKYEKPEISQTPDQSDKSDRCEFDNIGVLVTGLIVLLSFVIVIPFTFAVFAAVEFFPTCWWAVLAVLALVYQTAQTVFAVRRLDKVSSPAESVKLGATLNQAIAVAGLSNWTLRIGHYPEKLRAYSEIARNSDRKADPKVRAMLVKQCCAYSHAGRDVVFMCPIVMQELSMKEADAIIAHELGHIKHAHFQIHLVMRAVATLVAIAMTVALAPLFVTAGGSLNFFAVFFCLTVCGLLMTALRNFFARQFERKADEFAVRATGDAETFKSALSRVVELRNYDTERAPSLLDTHPSLPERFRIADRAA
ncbi:MAG: M48 family metalloprotease [Cyanobacteria bacterium HKST-UBA02]|nr:M48 family metalloprotease [Cyanobacteria bacterium HKST-UBA02]